MRCDVTMTDQERPKIDMELVRQSAVLRAKTFQAIGRFYLPVLAAGVLDSRDAGGLPTAAR